MQKGRHSQGAVATTKVTLNTVDIGLAQVAMHSSYETAGTKDALYMKDAVKAFCRTVIISQDDGKFEIR